MIHYLGFIKSKTLNILFTIIYQTIKMLKSFSFKALHRKISTFLFLIKQLRFKPIEPHSHEYYKSSTTKTLWLKLYFLQQCQTNSIVKTILLTTMSSE
jgi:hypothetical protein